MKKTTFYVAGMDCSAEEQLVRMKLEELSAVHQLQFDLSARLLGVYHTGEIEPVRAELAELELGAEIRNTTEAELPAETGVSQRRVLWWVLGINLSFFVIELFSGWFAWSMGLVADSLDMLADSIVYGLSLFAVGGAVARKQKVAWLSGYFQAGLAVVGFSEVVRRFLTPGGVPLFTWMIVVSLFALAGNLVSLWLISRTRTEEAHMRASAIFTSNDIVANGGVILAGLLVYYLNSKWPDLLIGTVVFAFVLRGAIKILKLSD